MKITKKESILILDYFDINTNESPSKIKNIAHELLDQHLCVPIIGDNFNKVKLKPKSKNIYTSKYKNN